MSGKIKFDTQARDFADDLSRLLNKTVAHGVRIKSVLQDDGAIGWVGYGITKTDFAPGHLIPLKLTKAPATCFLHIALTLHLDPEIDRLVVQRSKCGVYCHDDFESMVFHYDFDREPEADYPEAHFQVGGSNPFLDELCAGVKLSKALRELHFPVGGRRYRPSIEDVIEFLIVEGLAPGKTGWQDELRRLRENWWQIQLRSVVRRDPETAAAELRRQGYTISPPEIGHS